MDEDHAARLTPGAQRILDAASSLFYQHGIHAVGVDLIATRSGVTKRTLYDRFGSKETLVCTYLRNRHTQWWNRWQGRIRNTDHLRALTVFDSYAADAPGFSRGCAFLNAAGELPSTHPGQVVVREHKRRVLDRIEELVAEEPDVEDAAAVAEHVFLLLEGAIAHAGIDGHPGRLARARTFAEQLLRSASAGRGDAP